MCVTALDALERMEFLSTRPPRAPLRNTLSNVFHVCDFYMVVSIFLHDTNEQSFAILFKGLQCQGTASFVGFQGAAPSDIT